MANYKVSATLSARDQGFSSTMHKAVSSMNGVDSTAGRLSQRLKSGLGFGVVMAVGQKAVNAVTGAVRGMASQVGNAVNRFDTLNNFPKIMKNLGYSTKDANKALSTMSEGIDGLPTSLGSIASASQKIAPLTGNLDKAAKVTVAMNNALLAGGKSAETQSNALEQFSQMLSAGKVDMQAWRSMLDAMPGQMNQLAQSLLGADKNQADLYEAMKAGTVSFDDFNNALLQLNEKGLKAGGKEFASFAEQAKSATGGIGTQIANLKTGVVKGITSMITEADKTLHIGSGIKKMSEGIKGTLDKVAKSKTFKIMLGGIKAFIKGAVPVVREFAKAFGAVIAATAKAASKSGALKGALSGLKDMLIGAAKWIQQNSDTVVKLAKAAVVLWAAFKGYKIISSVVGGVRMLTTRFTGLLGAGSKLITSSASVGTSIAKIGTTAVSSLGLIGGAVAGAVGAIGAIGYAAYKEYNTMHASTIAVKKNQQARQQAINANKAEAAHITSTWEKLKALNKVENKSATEKARMKGYVEQLNGAIDGLNLKYDEESGKLKGNIQKINDKIEAYKREARAAVYKEQIKKATEDLIKQEEKEQELQKKIAALKEKGSQSTGDAEADANVNNQRIKEMTDLQNQLNDVRNAKKQLETEIGTFSIKASFDPKAFNALVTKAKQAGFRVPENIKQGIMSGKKAVPNSVYQLVKASDPQFKAAVNKAQRTGVNIPNSLKAGINSGKIRPAQAVKQLNALTAKENAKIANGSKKDGEKVPTETASGIKSKSGAVSNAASKLKDKANSGSSGVGAKGSTRGSQFGSGFVSGIAGWFSAAFTTAFNLAVQADKGTKSGQDSHSPSKKARVRGKQWYQGYVLGMAGGMKKTYLAAVGVVNQAFKGMHIATGKGFRAWGQSFTGLANKYINRLTNKVNAQVSKLTYRVSASISKAVNKQVKSLKAQKKARKELINNLEKVKESLKTKYSKYLEKEGNKLINTATKTLNKLANKYQKAYQKIVEAKNTFVGNLKSYGSLYQADSYGFITFENWGQDIKDIKAVTKNLKQLKKWGISQGLLNQITAMSTGDQLKFTSEIIKKGKQFFKTYNKGYTKFIKQSNKAGTAIYGSYVKALDKKYNKELKKTLNGLKRDLTNIGKQAGKGLINGLSNKDTKKKLQAVSKTLAQSIIKQIRKTLKIHSPSRVMAGLATQTGQGFINGLNAMSRSVQQASANMLQLPDLALQGAGLASVTGGQNLSLQGGMSIEVPLYINGREFARATAADMQNAINKRETRSSRNRGVR